MSVLRRVKLRTPDGIESIEYPLGVEAKNVEVANQENLSQRLVRIDEDLEKNEEDIAAVSELAGTNKQNIGANEIRIDALERRSASVDKKPYYFNTVADMKAYQGLKEGDMAVTLGYYSVNDGGAAGYKITDEESEIDYQEEIGGLYATLIIKDALNIKQLGAYGDDTHDDTEIIQKALDFVKNSGYPLYLPNGVYKVTEPITLEYKSDLNPPRPNLFKMFGDGGSLVTNSKGSIIKGYNIEENHAVLEIIGNGNTWGARCHFEDFVIIQDESTCNQMSFCFKLGDTYKSMLNNIRMKGFNDLLLRCGVTSQTWGNISLRFTSCTFSIFSDYGKGFSILPERVLVGTGQPSDNLLFESCNFNGIVCIDVANASFIECMESLTYKDVTSSNPGLLNGLELDYNTAYLVVGAKNLEFNNCYFEDFIDGIELYPLFTTINNVIVNNCYFNAISNMTDNSNNRIIANRAIYSRANSSHSSWINNILCINDCVFRSKSATADYGFTDAEIKNENSKYLNVTNYTNLSKDDTAITIKDNYSKFDKIVKHDYIPEVYTASIASLANYRTAFKFNNDVDYIKVLKKKSLQKVELFFETAVDATSFTFHLRDSSDTVYYELAFNKFSHSSDNKYWYTTDLEDISGTYASATFPAELKPTIYSTTFTNMLGAKVDCKITFGG